MTVSWLFYALLVGAATTGAAYCFERGLRNLGAGTRHAWTLGVIASAVLPFVPRIREAAPPVLSMLELPALAVWGGSAGPADGAPANVVLAGWLAAAALVCAAYVASWLRLRAAMRGWRLERVGDQEVYVSDDYGPAVFGFIRPRIVVPAWATTRPVSSRALIVLHERQHIAAHDHLLVLLTLVATAFMPWNPFVWLHARRLRYAMETDCDQRVLAVAPDRKRYASLLVEVGGMRSAASLAAALAERRYGLERSLVMIVSTVVRSRWRAALFIFAGAVLLVTACESRQPAEPKDAGVTATAVSVDRTHGEQARSSSFEETPQYRPATKMPELLNRDQIVQALAQSYPPVLRDAGIGGQTFVWLLVDEQGNVTKTRMKESSGRSELDATALALAGTFRFSPAKNGDTPVKTWIQVPIAFKAQ